MLHLPKNFFTLIFLGLLAMGVIFVLGASQYLNQNNITTKNQAAQPASQSRLLCGPNTRNKFVAMGYNILFDASWNNRNHNIGPWIRQNIIPNNPPFYPYIYYWGFPQVSQDLNLRVTQDIKNAYPQATLGDIRGYFSSDRNVINWHADKLSQLGVDMISVDATNVNGLDDPLVKDVARTVVDTYVHRIQQGLPTPKIIFHTNYLVDLPQPNIEWIDYQYNHARNMYGEDMMRKVFFYVNNKPLVLVVPEYSNHGIDLDPNVHFDPRLTSNFEVKKTWGLVNYADWWQFSDLTENNSAAAYMKNGWAEENAVTTAYYIHYPILPLTVPKLNGATLNAQWNAAQLSSPTFIFNTWWNLWSNINVGPDPNHLIIQDTWKADHNTDIEPSTNTSGEGDGMLYYNIDKQRIAQYKSISPTLVLWNKATGQWNLKYGVGHDIFASQNYSSIHNWTAGTQNQGFVGDFNGDGCVDIGLRNTNGVVSVGDFNGVNYSDNHTSSWLTGNQWQIFSYDYDFDGYTDILARDKSTGEIRWARNNHSGGFTNQGVVYTGPSGNNFQPFAGDFNGDGQADFALFNRTNGNYQFALKSGNVYLSNYSYNWNALPVDQPFVGDFNYDGWTDIAVRNSSNGMMYLGINQHTIPPQGGDIPFQQGNNYRTSYVGSDIVPLSYDDRVYPDGTNPPVYPSPTLVPSVITPTHGVYRISGRYINIGLSPTPAACGNAVGTSTNLNTYQTNLYPVNQHTFTQSYPVATPPQPGAFLFNNVSNGVYSMDGEIPTGLQYVCAYSPTNGSTFGPRPTIIVNNANVPGVKYVFKEPAQNQNITASISCGSWDQTTLSFHPRASWAPANQMAQQAQILDEIGRQWAWVTNSISPVDGRAMPSGHSIHAHIQINGIWHDSSVISCTHSPSL